MADLLSVACTPFCGPDQRAFASCLGTGMGHAEGLVVLVRVRSAEAPGNDVVRMSCLGLTTFLSAFATVRFVAEKRPANPRSEEHTSELQSLMRISYALFCLKKNQNQKRL